jgi:hypothetical protein
VNILPVDDAEAARYIAKGLHEAGWLRTTAATA